MPKKDNPKPDKVSPESILAALLAIKPEDAAEVREIADVKAKPDAQKENPRK